MYYYYVWAGAGYSNQYELNEEITEDVLPTEGEDIYEVVGSDEEMYSLCQRVVFLSTVSPNEIHICCVYHIKNDEEIATLPHKQVNEGFGQTVPSSISCGMVMPIVSTMGNADILVYFGHKPSHILFNTNETCCLMSLQFYNSLHSYMTLQRNKWSCADYSYKRFCMLNIQIRTLSMCGNGTY